MITDPLFKVQQKAFDQTLSPEVRAQAIAELGRRWANSYNGGSKWYSARYLKRLEAAYVRGFIGGAELISGHRRGGNWNRPLANAWFFGKRDCEELRELCKEHAVSGSRRTPRAIHPDSKFAQGEV